MPVVEVPSAPLPVVSIPTTSFPAQAVAVAEAPTAGSLTDPLPSPRGRRGERPSPALIAMLFAAGTVFEALVTGPTVYLLARGGKDAKESKKAVAEAPPAQPVTRAKEARPTMAFLPLPTGVRIEAPTEPGINVLAPEIEGPDMDGKTFKLSDYRGKVVVLDFWGDWCPPCRLCYPFERKLTERAQSESFVVLGVNCDADVDLAKKVIEREKIFTRCWSEPRGKPAHEFTLEHDRIPTLVVIDHKGVVRHRSIGVPSEAGQAELEQLITQLVRQKEKAAK